MFCRVQVDGKNQGPCASEWEKPWVLRTQGFEMGKSPIQSASEWDLNSHFKMELQYTPNCV